METRDKYMGITEEFSEDYAKVITTIKSCETKEHLVGACKLALNFHNKYPLRGNRRAEMFSSIITTKIIEKRAELKC